MKVSAKKFEQFIAGFGKVKMVTNHQESQHEYYDCTDGDQLVNNPNYLIAKQVLDHKTFDYINHVTTELHERKYLIVDRVGLELRNVFLVSATSADAAKKLSGVNGKCEVLNIDTVTEWSLFIA